MHLAISWFLAAVLLMASGAQAQSNPMAAILAALDKPEPSQALDAQAYRADAARHIYQHFRPLVHRGPLPAALQDIAILETTIDEQGAVEKVEVVREPSSGRATPWIVALIQAAQPYPVAALQGRVVYRDIWLITNEGRFQLDAISEGSQPQSASAGTSREAERRPQGAVPGGGGTIRTRPLRPHPCSPEAPMHRTPHRSRLRSWIAALALGAAALGAAAQPVDLAGAKFEPQVQVAGATLALNGAAIRYKVVFKVYAVGLYLPAKAATLNAVVEQPGPKRVHAVMLRDVGGSELGKNFTQNFEANVTREEFAASISQIFRFGELFASRKMMKAGESFTLDWVPGTGTILSVNGVPQGEPYPGAAFYSGLLKLWIGDRDSAGVRAALLGQAGTTR